MKYGKDDAIFPTAGADLPVPDAVRRTPHSGEDLHRSSRGDAVTELRNGLPQFEALGRAGQDPEGDSPQRQRTL